MTQKEKTKIVVEVKEENEGEKSSSKEAKHEPHKQSEKKKFSKRNFIVPALILVIALAIVYFVFLYNPYKFSSTIDGVEYVSSDYTPTLFFDELKKQRTIFVSPIMVSNAADPLVLNAMNLWQIVLIGNGINSVQYIREVDAQGKLVQCHTNDGNVYSNRIVQKEECLATLSNPSNFVISFEQSPQKDKARAILSTNKLVVESPMNSINAVNYSIMKQIFPNAEALIASVKEKIYSVNNSIQ